MARVSQDAANRILTIACVPSADELLRDAAPVNIPGSRYSDHVFIRP